MVVTYKFNANDADSRPINATIGAGGLRFMSRSKDKSASSSKIEGELSRLVSLERMGIAGY